MVADYLIGGSNGNSRKQQAVADAESHFLFKEITTIPNGAWATTLGVLQIFDAITTYYLVSNFGTEVELNPLMQFLMHLDPNLRLFVGLKVFMAFVLASLAYGILEANGPSVISLLIRCAVYFYIFIVLNNLWQCEVASIFLEAQPK